MNIRPYKDSDYPTLVSLWERYGWPACPPEALPGRGLVALTDKKEFIAYLAMYTEPGKMGFIDWALKDRERPKEESDHALRVLFGMLVNEAKRSGCGFIYSMTKTKSWGEKLESYGMLVAETGATTYIMALEGADTEFIRD